MADSQKAYISQIDKSLPALTLVVVDTLPLASLKHLQYFCTFLKSDGKQKTLNILVNKSEGDVTTQVYNRGGYELGLTIDAFINGANCELRVQNNENFILDFSALRTIL